jgi:hypothetical protein
MNMNTNQLRWPLTAYLSRAFMMPPTIIFMVISLRFLTNPTHAISPQGVAYSAPEAITDTRVMGALILALVVILLTTIFSQNRLRQAHLFIILIIGLALAVRLYGFVTDGTTISMSDERVKTYGEIIFLVLNSIGFVVQTIRVRPVTNHG